MPEGPAARVGGAVLAAIFLGIGALIFYGIYAFVPDHFIALGAIGAVALAFSILAYFAQAFTRYPTVPRALAWGFMAMGFTVLVLDLLFPPAGAISAALQLTLLIVVLLLALVWGFVIVWSSRERRMAAARSEKRAEWVAQPPPSAFTYSTARVPGQVSPPAPPAGSFPPPPTPPPGAT